MFEQMWKDNGSPELFMVDLRPLNYPVLLVASHKVAEQISRVTKLFPTSVNKSPTVGEFRRLMGSLLVVLMRWTQLCVYVLVGMMMCMAL